MSFLLDPFLAFMLGIIFSFIAKMLNLDKTKTFYLAATAISLATCYSVLLYLDVVRTDFLILDSFARILPIEEQFGPRIMFHSNDSGVTRDIFPVAIVTIFYALYFVWFYLGFKSLRNITAPREPTPKRKPQTTLLVRIGGLLVFVSAGMMLFFFLMIPLDRVAIGDSMGAKASPDLQNKEATITGYFARSDAKYMRFSDSLCNPDKIGLEKDPQVSVARDSSIRILLNEISGSSVGGIPSGITTQDQIFSADVRAMCDAREAVGASILFIFVNVSTWMILVAFFMLSTPAIHRDSYWNYGERESQRKPSWLLGE